MIEPSSRYEPDAQRAAGDVIDGEAIIIDLETGVYYSMQGVGGDIWSVLAAGATPAEITAAVTEGYAVEPERAAADVQALLAQLLEAGLVKPAAAGARTAEPALPAGGQRGPYAAPALVAYSDMQDLLALDPPAPGVTGLTWAAGDR